MKKIFCILVCATLFVACKKDTERITATPSPVTVNYQFDHLTFLVDDHTLTRLDSTLVLQRQVINKAVNELGADIGVPTPEETSKFTTSNTDARLPVALATKVNVPVALAGSSLIMGAKKWTYSANRVEGKAADIDQYRVKLSVTPYTRVDLDVYAKWQILRTDYVATFIDVATGRVIEVNGTWEGRKLRGFSQVASASNIK